MSESARRTSAGPEFADFADGGLQQLLENVRDYAVYRLDPEGRVCSWNAGAQAIKGYSAEEVLGKPYDLFFTDEDRRSGEPRIGLDRALASGRCEREGWRVRKGGSRFYAVAILTPIRSPSGAHLGFAKVTRDITQQHEMQQTLQRLNAELADRNRELEAFVYTASHELKSPLVTILGFLGYLRRDAAEARYDRVSEFADHMSEAASRMRQSIDDLLQLSRVGRLLGESVPVDLDALLRDLVSVHTPEIVEHRIRTDIATPLPTVRGDALRLRQLLDNLLINAIKYGSGSPSPVITFAAHRVNDEMQISVTDNGKGIPPQYLERVFRLFERLDRDGDGTGVGLTLCRRIVETHGGRMWAESPASGGARFIMTFPLDRIVASGGRP